MSNAVIPFLILVIVLSGLFSRLKVFELFTKGVKEGLVTVFNLFPVLLGLFLAVTLLRASGLIGCISYLVEPFLSFLNIPKELVGIIALKPISGSASLAIATDIINEYDAKSLISFIAAIIMGSTETMVYAISVYSGNIKKKMSYKVLILAFLGNIIAVYLSAFFGRLFF